jgi:Zn-dependent protease
MLVAAAGPAMNILFGILISLILLVLVKTEATGNIELLIAVRNAIVMNFILAFFNLIPAPPLDGGTVLAGLLPDRMLPAYRMYAPYGIFVLLLVMFSSKLQMIFVWPAVELWRLWGGLLGLA